MFRHLLWWTAVATCVGSILCLGRSFLYVIGLLVGQTSEGGGTFAAFAALVTEARAWSLTGIGLFVATLVLLACIPGDRPADRPEAEKP